MFEIVGKYTSAKIMSDNIEETAYTQILEVCNQKIFEGAHIVIQPDCHAGAGCVIGFTMPLTNFVIPNLIGVDIGCSVSGYKLGTIKELSADEIGRFDIYLRANLPSGFSTQKKCFLPSDTALYRSITTINAKLGIKDERILNSIGSLGGGNHFVEIGKTDKNEYWLFIHSGSRNFGLQIAKYHQAKARQFIESDKIIGVQRGLEYLKLDTYEGQAYIQDMKTAQEYAVYNHKIMSKILLDWFSVRNPKTIHTTHNYINFADHIMRKGAISAQLDEEVIIPFNMRDGVIIAKGKGNKEWNYSAPHGAGRILGRKEAKRQLSMEQFREEMKNVYSSCIDISTLDEAPMAYKPKEEILKHIGDTLEILDFIKPIYNFKASEE